jgi:hypothetical protein
MTDLFRLVAAVDAADGFDRGLLLWRMHSTTAAIRFSDPLISEGLVSGEERAIPVIKTA